MTGTVEFIQRIRYVEIPDEKGEMHVYAIPETVENVQELIRCKDCKRRGTYSCPVYVGGDGMCSEPDDWFCADGEGR